MATKAKLYIAIIAALAALMLAVVASRWNPESLSRFFLFFGLAMAASAMKIRLPGFKTTISTNFVFILAGIALFSFGETVLIGLGGALVQSLWKTQTRPKPVQVLFNAAFWTSHTISTMLALNSMPVMMVLGTCVYVVLNTGLVSLVISLAEGRSLRDLWSSCYEWTFPYFLVGAAIAGLASAASYGANGINLGVAMLVIPAMYFVYVYYRMHIIRAVLENISSVSGENEASLASSSQGR